MLQSNPSCPLLLPILGKCKMRERERTVDFGQGRAGSGMLEGLHVPFRSHPVRQARILPLQWPEDLWLRDQDQVPGRSIWDVQGFDPFGILCMMSDRSLIFPFPCGRSVIIAPCEYFIYSYSFVIVLFSYMMFQYHCETKSSTIS